RFLILNFNAFVNLVVPLGISRRLSPAEMRAYRGPFPTRASRVPAAIFPKEILQSHDYLGEVESNLTRLRHKPALILWGDQNTAFRDDQRHRFELLFTNHRSRILKGAKHFVQEDAPEQICDEVLTLYESFARQNVSAACGRRDHA